MKLILELDVDMSDFTELDAQIFLAEAKEASGITVEIGRPLSEEQSEIVRSFSLSTEYFKARIATETSESIARELGVKL